MQEWILIVFLPPPLCFQQVGRQLPGANLVSAGVDISGLGPFSIVPALVSGPALNQVSCNLTDAAAAAALCHSAATNPQRTVVRDAHPSTTPPRANQAHGYYAAAVIRVSELRCRTPHAACHMPHATCHMPDSGSPRLPLLVPASKALPACLRLFGHGCPKTESHYYGTWAPCAAAPPLPPSHHHGLNPVGPAQPAIRTPTLATA